MTQEEELEIVRKYIALYVNSDNNMINKPFLNFL
jgi:hypothetical protein